MAKESTKTKEAEPAQAQNIAQEQPRERQAVAVLQPTRLPYHPIYQERYGVDGPMWRALVDAVFPSAKTPEGVILAVSYCKSRNLDVMKRPVHVVPIWSTAQNREIESVWEGIGGLRTTAFRTGAYGGCDEAKFGPDTTFHFDDEVGKGNYAKRIVMDVVAPEWAQITVYRIVQGVRCAFPGPKVHFLGSYGSRGKSEIPNDKWAETPHYMLEKCAEAAALRKAFPEELGGILTAEEMEGRKTPAAGATINHDDAPPPPRPTRQSTAADVEQSRKEDYERNAQFRSTMADAPEEIVVEEDHDADAGEIKDADQTIDYSGTVKMLLAKIEQTTRPKILDTFVTDFADEIKALEVSKPDHDAVQAAIEAKRKYFAR